MNTKKKIVIFLSLFIIILLAVILFANEYIIDNFIRDRIEKKLGPSVKIGKLFLCVDSLCAENVKIYSMEGDNFLDVSVIKIKPYLLSLLKGNFQIKEISFKNPKLTLKRDRNKRWHIAKLKGDETKSPSYLPVETLRITEGEIEIIDELKGAKTKFNSLELELNNDLENKNLSIKANAKVEKGGSIEFNSKGNYIAEYFEGTLKVTELPIKTVMPYINTDLKISSGTMSFQSNFTIKNGYINAPSFLKARNVEIASKGFFMGIAGSVLIKILQKNNEVTVNFNIWGRWDNLHSDFKDSLKKKISEETERSISSPIKSIISPLKGIIKK
ncbi:MULTISPECIES: DUF748 domain-containing protein [Thermodesulfovibrio]|jgi:uncharacterized protein involved in outer membrane biogenesis|uniref:DUF748 domain-containing protein n=1 Tax=Thermodesulfovibrio TaxID=28261 RepID=UPI0026320AF9|nr:DUF748 domain-containing protein [Thermodesulfovibrio sp.]